MNSLEIVEFELALDEFVKSSPLPTEVKRMVLSDILRKQSAILQVEISAQLSEREGKANEQDVQ